MGLRELCPLADIYGLVAPFPSAPDVARIVFPVPSSVLRQNDPGIYHVVKSDMKATKIATLNSKIADDTEHCYISGIDFVENSSLRISDCPNKRVKVFTPDYKFLSSLTLPHWCYSIRIVSPTTAVTSAYDKNLHIPRKIVLHTWEF